MDWVGFEVPAQTLREWNNGLYRNRNLKLAFIIHTRDTTLSSLSVCLSLSQSLLRPLVVPHLDGPGAQQLPVHPSNSLGSCARVGELDDAEALGPSVLSQDHVSMHHGSARLERVLKVLPSHIPVQVADKELHSSSSSSSSAAATTAIKAAATTTTAAAAAGFPILAHKDLSAIELGVVEVTDRGAGLVRRLEDDNAASLAASALEALRD